MTTVKRPLADEDGNDFPPLDPSSDVAKLIHLLEYARRRGFRLGPTLQIGDTIVQVRDLRQDTSRPQDPEQDIWEENGHKEK